MRLAPDGQIAIAYPFSAVPTRNGVRIAGPPGEGVDVFAMCAIDALGISAMLGRDTVIETVDVVSGRPITITTSDGRTSWELATAVAFVGAEECGGPSADCCCDYLNVFADDGAAQAWADAHPNVPGQILSQQEAEELAVRLFGHLLSAS
ncbi:alkylmercury lyase family protein [Kribbella shirazensis]|uniref:alkylmercury lyase family protein n=1 Tax=Kribbella shirazensis TaxID=1105143 RepID=UPI00307F902F